MQDTASWGLCIHCKWWQIEPYAAIMNDTKGLCIDQKLQPYLLRVSGDSGCNLFVDGVPARVAGSGDSPPTARPVR